MTDIKRQTEKALVLIVERKYKELRDLLSDMPAVDIAQLMGDLPKDIIPLVYRLLPKELAAETFVEMDTDMQETLIQSCSSCSLTLPST